MPTTFWGPTNPTAMTNSQAVDGDIFVSTNTLTQRRRVASAPNVDGSTAGWVWIVPPGPSQTRLTPSDTRADVVPSGGLVNDRLALIDPGNPWQTGWANAAAGVVGPPATASPTGVEGRHEEPTPVNPWTVNHNLSALFVNVTVIGDDNETLIMPRVEYSTPMTCILHFAEPVAGTAIVRR